MYTDLCIHNKLYIKQTSKPNLGWLAEASRQAGLKAGSSSTVFHADPVGQGATHF